MYKCTEQDQISELPLIAAEARAAYDAQAAAQAESPSGELPSVFAGMDVSAQPGLPNTAQESLTGKGDGLTYQWIGLEDMEKLAFPNVFLKLIRNYFAGAYDEVSE